MAGRGSSAAADPQEHFPLPARLGGGPARGLHVVQAEYRPDLGRQDAFLDQAVEPPYQAQHG